MYDHIIATAIYCCWGSCVAINFCRMKNIPVSTKLIGFVSLKLIIVDQHFMDYLGYHVNHRGWKSCYYLDIMSFVSSPHYMPNVLNVQVLLCSLQSWFLVKGCFTYMGHMAVYDLARWRKTTSKEFEFYRCSSSHFRCDNHSRKTLAVTIFTNVHLSQTPYLRYHSSGIEDGDIHLSIVIVCVWIHPGLDCWNITSTCCRLVWLVLQVELFLVEEHNLLAFQGCCLRGILLHSLA